MSAHDGAADPPPGRLVLVTGAGTAGTTGVAHALATRLPRAVHVDGQALAAMVVSGAVPLTPAPPREAVEQLFLRWLAGIAVAETYQRAGFDAVLSDAVLSDAVLGDAVLGETVLGDTGLGDTVVGGLLEDFLDFVSPAPLHLVVLHAQPEGTRRPGLWIEGGERTADETVDAVLERLDGALVDTSAFTDG